MKRFYDSVAVKQVDGGWQVTLDQRGLKTVKGSAQILPSQQLAEAVAREWSDQGEEIDTAGFVFRDLSDYALDVVSNDREAQISKLLAYIETDTLCYRADPEDALYARQHEVWEPVLAEFENRFGVALVRVSGVIHRAQADTTRVALGAKLAEASEFTLAGMETLASLSASLSIALMAADPDSDVEHLWRAASLEEEWQADLWGRDQEAQERREKRRSEFLKAVEFVRLAEA